MERDILQQLATWKNSKRRKPLILQGARQVGKTWALREFGRIHYQNTAYFNFDEHGEYGQFFELSKDPERIVANLSMATGQPIFPEKTLIIFDEIQDTPAVISSLKYFCEHAPRYHVACAGSLLGITLAKPASFPVGKANLLKLYPLTFAEFLRASGDAALADYIAGIDTIEPLPDTFFNPLSEKLKMYFVTGGMPEAVLEWAENRDVEAVQAALQDMIALYERDFQKHAEPYQFAKIEMVWNSLPSQLARENKKFLYSLVKTGARAREYEDAVQWLVKTDLLTRVYRCSSPALPLVAYDELTAFKLYALDVGLLRRHSFLAPSAFTEGNRLFTEFKGALTENYVLQALTPQFEVVPRYWAQDNPRYEVDFLIQNENEIIPIEVKAGKNVGATSLKKYRESYGDRTKTAIRFSLKNFSLDGGILNIPLFLAGETKRLLTLRPTSPSELK